MSLCGKNLLLVAPGGEDHLAFSLGGSTKSPLDCTVLLFSQNQPESQVSSCVLCFCFKDKSSSMLSVVFGV